MRIHHPNQWPANCKWIAASGGSITGVFVTYASATHPLPMLGYPGDVWVMPAAIFCKNGTSWTRWHTSMEVKCPYDSNLVLMWSTHGCFKEYQMESWVDCCIQIRFNLLMLLCVYERLGEALFSPIELESLNDLQKYDYCKPSHQYMHKPFPADKYKEPLDGRRSSGSVKCPWNDMDMFLPYCADAGADEEGDDIDMCRWLAGGVDATSPLDTNSTPVVTVLRTPPPCSSLQAWKEHISEAHSILAQGHAVAILDYVETGPENKWSEESLCAIASRDLQTVKGTIQKFWCDATDPTERVNCLDIVMYGHLILYIISQLSSVSRELSATAAVGFQGAQLKPDNKPPKKKQRLEHVLAELKGSDNSLGIGSMEWDADRSSSWGLLATAGAFTAPHHDAGGTLTFVLCRRDEYFETIKKLTTPANILLPANTLLIQPPGCVHQVYTLDNSICTGGHFLMLDSMHLTEITRIGAVITKQTATNASHPSVIWLLSRITIGILYENNCNVLRKPFISLARMILWPTMYIEGDLDPDNPSFVYSEESRSELKAAQSIARDILQHNNISVAKIEPTMKAWEEGRWLADDRDVAWNAPGAAVVAIPDRRTHFVAFDNAEA
ncbi:hypothetical protein BC835DRAFT_1306988 [Cytidiella melzeri]|nr:hypothetical protein BC835DRAFT_1306988 [Cytidiella melzeri]